MSDNTDEQKEAAMEKLNLTRQNHLEPDLKELEDMLISLKSVLRSKDLDCGEWQDNLRDILKFQDTDGSFKLVDSFRIESDARVDFCYMPTYLCTAILMKALMYGGSGMVASVKEALATALKVCCGRGLTGHGYDSFRGKVEALKIFMKAGLREFLLMYPDLSRVFTDMIVEISTEFADREAHEDYLAGWGADFTAEIKAINAYLSTYTVFVYGTLLQGEKNHDFYLSESNYSGKAHITGFDMYDIGCFPGIVPGDSMVKGELYVISKDTLSELDYLEGEGSLYVRRCVPAMAENGETSFSLVYIYNYSVDNLERIPETLQPYTESWKDRLNNYVWYVSYGSNMLSERFMHYIKGGQYEGGGAYLEPCADTSDPIAVATYNIPYDMYFRNSSGSWGGKGVSFLDTSKPGHALGVAYLITKEQFEHVACQENGGCPPEYSSWYNTIVSLGTLNGYEVVTITNDSVAYFNAPSEKYLETLHRGIAEHYPEMSGEDIGQYLMECIR